VLRPLLAGALAAGALAAGALLAAPAGAACLGTDQTVYACSSPQVERREITQCVYAGGDTCQDVTVPYVMVTGGQITCGGDVLDRQTVLQLSC
jgi:hypothetical protein